MANFKTYITRSSRNGNLTVRYRDGKTKRKSGAWKMFTVETIDKNARIFAEGEWKNAQWMAEKLEQQAWEQYMQGKLGLVGSNELLSDLIEKYLVVKKDVGWKTQEHYRNTLELLLKYITSLKDLTKEKMEAWREHLKKTPIKGGKIGYANNTIHGALNDTRMFCNWLVYEKKIAVSPFKPVKFQEKPIIPAQTKARPRFYDIGDFVKLEVEVAKLDPIVHVACRLGHDCGLRKVEICGDDVERFEGVRLEDLIVHPDGKCDLNIRDEITKGKNSGGVVRVPESLVALILQTVGRRRTGPICPIKMMHFNWVVKKAMRIAGIKKVPGLFIHSFRHSQGKNHLQSGGKLEDLQKILRHKDIATTQIYGQFEPSYLGKAIDRTADTVELEKARIRAEQNAGQNSEVKLEILGGIGPKRCKEVQGG